MHIIAGLYRNRCLLSPKGEKTRPTASRLRESFFNICQGYIEGASFLDLFAGSGAIGLEALSRGAKSATFVDSSKEAIQCIRQNISHLHVESQSEVLYGPVFQILKLLEKQKQQFDIIYADPPYQMPIQQKGQMIYYSEKIIHWMDEHSLINSGGFLFIEEAFESLPLIETLKTLKLKSSRRSGGSALHQYTHPGSK